MGIGLLDWLAEGLGGGSGGMPPGLSDGGMAPQGPGGPSPMLSMPPVQTLETAPPPMPPVSGPQNHEPTLPLGGDPMTAGGGAPNGPGLPFATGTDPMLAGGEMPNGPGLPPMPPKTAGPSALPPNAAPTGGAGMPGQPLSLADANGIVKSYEGAGGTAFAPPQGGTALTRSLGLDPNTARSIGGSLAAGLKAAGENAHKPGLAAFAGSAGSAMEGGQKRDDKTTDQQDKYLARAIQAKKAGNDALYQQNYLRYQIEAAKAKLEASKERAAGKDSVMNSPEQLYLRGVGATNADGELKILAARAKEAEKLGDQAAAKAAMEAYNKRRQEVLDGHLKTLGVDPGKVKGISEKPGFSDKNPVKDFPKDPAAAQKAFDALPEGAYFINPKDGRLLTKKSAGGAASANPAQTASLPPMPPMPSNPSLAMASEEA